MYTFKAVQWGRDVTETYRTRREMFARVSDWLMWDEEGGYMRCAPERLYGPNGYVCSYNLYDASHDVMAWRKILRTIG